MSDNEKMEIGVDGALLLQARDLAATMLDNSQESLSFRPSSQNYGNQPEFIISRSKGNLFIFTSFEVGGEMFYLGTNK
jgi:hypothetical protein